MGFQGILQRYIAGLALTSLCEASGSVTLPGYGTFVGTTINQTLTKKPLPSTVDAWLGIDYATQPVGDARFAPVQAPAAFDGTKNATAYGLSCIQDRSMLSYEQGEACLSMNVFRPQNISASEKLPILIWIHGGGFISGSSRSFDGPSFVANSKEKVIVVTFNYRVTSLGFLPSPVFERLGLLNLGLRDQELLFKFVQQYISKFGGDPDRVTIGGRSAGAHSVGIHLFHNYNKTKGPSPLFSQAILQSGSVTARAFPNASYPLYLKQWAEFVNLIGCSQNGTDSEILGCLRSVSSDAIRDASDSIWNEYEYHITWPFQPTRGGPLLEQAGSTSGYDGQFYHVPTITTNVRDEAKYYSPGDIETNQQFLDFMHVLIPDLTAEDLSDLETLYPDPTGDVNGDFSPYAHSPNSTQYDRLSAALSDYMYICAGQETAVRMSSAGVPVYKLRFTTNNTFPDWKGIPHTSDTKYTWNEPKGTSGIQYPEIARLLSGYFSDFVALGDPNKGNRTGVPKWPKYVDNAGNGLPGLQLKMEPFGNTRVEGDAVRRQQCEWWRDPSRAGRLEK